MASLSRFHKLGIATLGALGGGLAYHQLNKYKDNNDKYSIQAAWTANHAPSQKWDKNWDHRDPESLIKPLKSDDPENQNKHNEKLDKAKGKGVRHLFLIRHGQYNTDGATDKERILTALGRQQADETGKRLANLGIKWDLMVRSTMTRAQETACIIAKHLPKDIEVKDSEMLEEGAPIRPDPPVTHWKPDRKFFQDGARIEAAFRRYFYRAPPDQKHDTYTLLVCHANVIRFFVCRALQFPPEGWLRLNLNHGSITWVSIMPNGNVILRALSDAGFMEPKTISSR